MFFFFQIENQSIWAKMRHRRRHIPREYFTNANDRTTNFRPPYERQRGTRLPQK